MLGVFKAAASTCSDASAAASSAASAAAASASAFAFAAAAAAAAAAGHVAASESFNGSNGAPHNSRLIAPRANLSSTGSVNSPIL
jgi:hypothetical protein